MSDLLTRPVDGRENGREPLQASFSDAANPLGLDGIEFIEYATAKPQALGQVLEMMGFRPVARHRSREVLLYRQGGLNIPAVHGAGGSRIHFFGVVQYIGPERSNDWIEFYRELFGIALIPDEQRFGIMPKGTLLRTPSRAGPSARPTSARWCLSWCRASHHECRL